MMDYRDALAVIQNGPIDIPAKRILGKFESLYAFDLEELDHFKGILGLMKSYIALKKPDRPLCIGIFGPPGAGKSFSVKAIAAKAAAEGKVSMPLTTFNLTQIPSPLELSALMQATIHSLETDVIPVLFFDEFDAPLNGQPLGWLNWFLAPMHDGHFSLAGKEIPLKKAIYVFAGGTSSTFQHFCNRRDVLFKNAKGPDFVSRLRGVLNVKGPNDVSSRDLRRALILHFAIKERSNAFYLNKVNHKMLTIDEDLACAMLEAGRFRHGARSLGAIIEMCAVNDNKLAMSGLPSQHLMQGHVDRGPLDVREIKGDIGLSAGSQPGDSAIFESTWRAVAVALWQQGATIIYGGDPTASGLTSLLAAEQANLPKSHIGTEEKENPPFLRWIDRTGKGMDDTSLMQNICAEPVPLQVQCTRPDLVARFASATQNKRLLEWLGKSLDMHRLRCQMNDQTVARIVIGGKLLGYQGRFPGIFEELLLALNAEKPVYVVGGFGGAAEVAGSVMGLGKAKESSLQDPFAPAVMKKLRAEGEAALRQLAPLFGSEKGLPVSFGDALDALWRHAIHGPTWVDNGLSRQENKTLFHSTDTEEIRNLILKGLLIVTRKLD